jgi:hypothetical protein
MVPRGGRPAGVRWRRVAYDIGGGCAASRPLVAATAKCSAASAEAITVTPVRDSSS